MNVEQSFYSRPGQRQGSPGIRVASRIENQLTELYVTEETFNRAAHLVDRLQRRVISRRHYRILVAIMIENSLRTGQVEETEQVMLVLAKLWRSCPQRYLTWW
jgi:hypothetical protein